MRSFRGLNKEKSTPLYTSDVLNFSLMSDIKDYHILRQ